MGLSTRNGIEVTGKLKDYVVFDFETTGVRANCDKIIEIGAVKVRDHEIVDRYSQLINPECHIPAGASNVNGIYDYMVCDKPVIYDAISDFIEFIGDDILIGHNIATFDMKFLYRDIERIYEEPYNKLDNRYLDTLKMARRKLNLKNNKLTDLAEYFGISSTGAHRALADVEMNMRIYEELCKK